MSIKCQFINICVSYNKRCGTCQNNTGEKDYYIPDNPQPIYIPYPVYPPTTVPWTQPYTWPYIWCGTNTYTGDVNPNITVTYTSSDSIASAKSDFYKEKAKET